MAPTTTASAPTNEIGVGSNVGTLSWGTYMDDKERVPELRWPRSNIEYDKMRNHAQIQALAAGILQPIMGYWWGIDPNGATEDVVTRLSFDLGLPIKGRTDEFDDAEVTFSHEDCLRHALLAPLGYGHMFMEQVGRIDDDGWFRYTKLAPRMPMSIGSIEVESDGGLKGIKQNYSRTSAMMPPLIPVDRLVAFVWDREGDNWAGRSMLRPIWPNWMLQTDLLRVDATKHRRQGMGIPIARATNENVGRRALAIANKMMQRMRAGMNSGGALPFGIDMKLMGVEGNVPDTLASIKYHDEAMARAFLMMFIQLGQTDHGARALGESFIDFFSLALNYIAKWYAKVMTQHVVRDWVNWNVAPGTSRIPKIVFEPLPPELAAETLVSLIEKGAIHVDDETEAWVRMRYRIPVATTARPVAPVVTPADAPAVAPPVAAAPRKPVKAASTSPIPLPARTLRRQPYEFEVSAAVDFAQMDADYEDAVSSLVSAWSDVREGQINELVDIIAQTDPSDLQALAAIAAQDGLGAEAIADIMHDLADKGAAAAVQEAKSQGVTSATVPDLDDVKESLTTRAESVDVLLTRALSEAAARKAVSLAGSSLDADTIANDVGTYLKGLTDTYLEEQFSGVASQAQNAGRRKVLNEQDPTSLYASELLDKATCTSCKAIDGKQYDSVEAAEADYPSGGYKDCKGGPKCRGTLVGIYGEDD